MARKRGTPSRVPTPAAAESKSRRTSRLAPPTLLVVLALALLIRLWGINDRLPNPALGIRVFDDSVVEETDRVTMGLAWSMWQGGTKPIDLNPHTGGWPGLSAYLTLGVQMLYRAWFTVSHPGAGAAAFAQYTEDHWDSLFLAARCVGALIGAATVALTLELGAALLGPGAGFASALLLALNPLHIQTSQHVSDPNLLALLFVLVAARSILRLAEGGGLRDSVTAGAAIGLAAASKYAPLVLLPVLLLALAGVEGRPLAWIAAAVRSRTLWLGVAAAASAVFIASPFPFPDLTTTVRDLSIQRERLLPGWVRETAFPISLPSYLLSVLPGALGWPAYLLGLAGAVLLWRSGRTGKVMISIPILLVLANGMLRTAQERYVLPAMPILDIAASAAVFAAAPLLGARVRLGRVRALAPAALLVLGAAWPLPAYVATRASLALPDTRHVARAWIDAQINRAEPMAVELYGPSFNTVRPDERAAVTWPFYATLAPMVRPAYDYSFLDGFKYVVLSSEVSRRFESIPGAYPTEAAYYARIRKRAQLLWSSASTRASAPRIEIRELPGAIRTRSERDSAFARLLPKPNGSSRLALWCLQTAQLFAEKGQFDRMEEWASRGLRIGAPSLNGELSATLAYAQLASERPAD